MSATAPSHAMTIRECWACLNSTPIGRLAYVENGQPAIRPVNFTARDGEIVIWSWPGSKAKALRNHVVAFQASQIDPNTRTGRSVVVLGTAWVMPDEYESLSQVEPIRRPWVSGSLDHVIRIRVQRMTGQCLAWPATPSPAGEPNTAVPDANSAHPSVSPGPWIRTTAGWSPLVELDTRQCWTRLRAAPVGRLVWADGTVPVVRTAHHTVSEGHIVCWYQGAGATVGAGDSVVFEVDDIDPRTRTGWSVLAHGAVAAGSPVGAVRVLVAGVTGRQVLPAAGRDGDSW